MFGECGAQKQSKCLPVWINIGLSFYLSLILWAATAPVLWKRRLRMEEQQQSLHSRGTAPWQTCWAASPGTDETKLCLTSLSSQLCMTRWILQCASSVGMMFRLCFVDLGLAGFLLFIVHTWAAFGSFLVGWEIMAARATFPGQRLGKLGPRDCLEGAQTWASVWHCPCSTCRGYAVNKEWPLIASISCHDGGMKKPSSLFTVLAAMCKTVLITLWLTSFRYVGKV